MVSCDTCIHIQTCKIFEGVQKFKTGFDEAFENMAKFPFDPTITATTCQLYLSAKNLKVDLLTEASKKDKLQ
jgi:hypothetical protein